MNQVAKTTPKAPTKRRISPKIREAIKLKVQRGITWKEAAKQVGISEAGIHKARLKTHIKEFEEQCKLQFIQSVDANRATYKAQAYNVAKDLMHNGISENVRMRAVEFLAGEGKQNPVNVAVQVNNHMAGGYEYKRPNQKIVEIKDASDSPSHGQEDETPVK